MIMPCRACVVCPRMENTECLFPHLKIGHDAAMKAVIAGMEGHRISVQQKLMNAPPPLELEDETVEDEPNEPRDDADDINPEVVIIEPDVDEEAPPVPVPHESQSEPISFPEVEPPPVDKATADRLAMPPPPPRPPASTCPAASTIPAETKEPPPSSAPPPADDRDTERESLLRQLDLLRLKFKQSVIPPDIENQATPAVRVVVERNLTNLKRARHGRLLRSRNRSANKHCHVQAGSGGVSGGGGVCPRPPHTPGHEFGGQTRALPSGIVVFWLGIVPI